MSLSARADVWILPRLGSVLATVSPRYQGRGGTPSWGGEVAGRRGLRSWQFAFRGCLLICGLGRSTLHPFAMPVPRALDRCGDHRHVWHPARSWAGCGWASSAVREVQRKRGPLSCGPREGEARRRGAGPALWQPGRGWCPRCRPVFSPVCLSSGGPSCRPVMGLSGRGRELRSLDRPGNGVRQLFSPACGCAFVIPRASKIAVGLPFYALLRPFGCRASRPRPVGRHQGRAGRS